MAELLPPVAGPLPGSPAATARRWIALRRAAGAVRGSKAATVGAAILAVHLVLAVLGPALAPYPYTAFHMTHLLEAPSRQFLAGTDQFGRDQLSRVMWGARGTLTLAAVSTMLGETLGVTVGLAGGYYRGVVDEVLMRTMDALMAFPSILLAMLILTSLGHSPAYVVIGISVVFMPRAARVLRGVVLSLASSEFVDAARLRGERGWYILFRELLPNAWTPIIVDSTIRFSYAILLATSLGFLGLGAAPPSPDWGLMINEALPFLNQAPWLALLPSLAISSAVVGANLLGDGIQASLRPE
ncbi:MAG TPA: ABC transporter permease [bacterium]|nr:ABC transporter permease [bacterium]